jgi:hypothetical protein
VSSFTTDYDNRNMWENYADKYRGFCVEYDFRRINPQNSNEIWKILFLSPVTYHRVFNEFNTKIITDAIIQKLVSQKEFNMDLEELNFEIHEHMLMKKDDYKSEKEWRLILKAEHKGLIEFPFTSRIILGKDIDDSDEKILLGIARDKGIPIEKQILNYTKSRMEYIKLCST